MKFVIIPVMSKLTEKWNKSHAEIPSNKSVSSYAIQREKEFPRGSTVCDLGGGTGVDALYFLDHGHNVQLIDISDFALAKARDKAQEKGLDLETHMVTLGHEAIPLGAESMDIVYSRLALHYFDRRVTTEILKEVFRILKKGGKAFIVIKSPDDVQEMEFLRRTAVEKEEGVFEDGGEVKSRFTKEQLEDMLTTAGITDFMVDAFVENLDGRVDKVKSGNNQLLLNEIQFSK